MKLMFLGDRIWGNSAYSKVIYNLTARLKDEHEIAHIPMGRALRGGKFNQDGILLLPSGDNPSGEDVATRHYHDFNADMLITVKEPWIFRSLHNEAINYTPMAIIDHSPVSPHITSKLRTAFKVIAISRHGQKELKNKDIDSTYIPHGVPTKIYKPLNERQRKICKTMFQFEEDEFVVLMVQMNRSRKLIPHQLRGYKRFLELNPDVKSRLMLWTNMRPTRTPEDTEPGLGVADVGVDLIPELFELGLEDPVRWTDLGELPEGIPEWTLDFSLGGWDMVKLYNSADALFHCTGGEGAGLPLLEAQACGVPVMTTDYAGGPEHVGCGYKVKAEDYVILNTPGTRYYMADIDEMAENLTKIMNGNPEKMRKKARAFAERFDWDNVVDKYMNPFLDDCEQELYPKITKDGLKKWSDP